ncbi:MAG: hypothetical protein ACRD15_00580 [Vicinamibacterales bacterium]
MPKHSLYARRRIAFTAAIFTSLAPGWIQQAAAQPSEPLPCAACIVLLATPGQSVLIAEPLNGVEVVVRAETGTGDRGIGTGDRGLAIEASGQTLNGTVAAMEVIRRHGGRPGLLIRGTDPVDPIEALATAHRIVVDVTGQAAGADLAFRLKTRLTELRGARLDLVLGVLGAPDLLDTLLQQDLAPYVDFIARTGGGPAPYPVRAASQTLASVYPAAGGARPLPAGDAERWLVDLPDDVIAAVRLLTDVARTALVLREGLIAGGTVDVRCRDVGAATYLDPESLDTVAISRGCGEGPLTITPSVTGVRRVSLSGGDLVVRVPAAEGRFAEGVHVVGARALSVREIIARHQAAAARQRRAVRTRISTGSMTLTFEAPGFPAPMAISSEAVIYAGPDRVEIEQRDVRVNGIAFRGGGVPRLPLLEPERVASPPLAITLTEMYRYTLEGQEDVRGVRCHVVGFQPTDRSRPLFAGRAWIAADTFAMVKVAAVQTGLRGAIVSSEQTDEFRAEGEGIWLLARSEVRQIYEGAGHRTPIHRVLAIARHEINVADFGSRRAAAYRSPSIMLRDTAEGYRYLERDPASDSPRTVVPAVAGKADRVRTLALGVILDPNISKPLPFAGLSYVDFDLFGTGTQLNGFFGGSYGQLAVSVPSLGGTRWQLAGRAFGIASSYNDRAFVDGREIYRANISQRPAHASVWLLRPLTARLTARAGYDFDYTHFGRVDSTAASFVVPATQAAHAMRLAIEGQWVGWTASLWWAGARRAGWRRWGETTGPVVGEMQEYDPSQRDYQRFGAVVTRSVVVSPRLVGRVEAAWMAGQDLDRFSRYTFGSFDNRLRGYPSALIRYDRGAVVRSVAAWAAGRLLRIDGFVDTAYVHDPGFGARSRSYTGLGAAAEVPAPFGTLLAVEWGYGFQGIDSDGGRGTHVVRISGYKMF